MLGAMYEVNDLLNDAKWNLWVEDELTQKIFNDLNKNETFKLTLKIKFEL
jgi:hypothetical protein